MDVILLQRIEKLGQMGEVVRVRAGFARNYLLPQKKALRATDANKARFEKQRAQLEANNLARRQEAEGISGKVDGITVVVIRQAGETGHLYGSVSARDISEAVTKAGITIDRNQVLMDRPIKMLGLHPVRVALHPEVVVSITANVAKSAEEAEAQKNAGGFVPALEEGPTLDDMLAEVEAPAEEQPAEAEAQPAPAEPESKPAKKAKAEKAEKAEKAPKEKKPKAERKPKTEAQE
jgi:large subunit ribosomal protein L9